MLTSLTFVAVESLSSMNTSYNEISPAIKGRLNLIIAVSIGSSALLVRKMKNIVFCSFKMVEEKL